MPFLVWAAAGLVIGDQVAAIFNPALLISSIAYHVFTAYLFHLNFFPKSLCTSLHAC